MPVPFRSFVSSALLAMLLLVVMFVHYVIGFVRRTHIRDNPKLVMLGTFYNQGWYKAHVAPLDQCNTIEEVIVICDEPVPFPSSKVRFSCPDEKLVRLLGRNLSRLLMLLRVAWNDKPQFYMGYHIMPNGLLALLFARIFAGHAIYQMTGGPAQIVGGGYLSENPLLRSTAVPRSWLESLLFATVRCFDAVIVRGTGAESFLKERELAKRTLIVTGAIDTTVYRPDESVEKDIDVLYVARLIPEKGHSKLIGIIDVVRRKFPDVRVEIVGDGPLLEPLKAEVEAASLESNVTFSGRSDSVDELHRRSKIYALISDTEGMSIAMLEAMGSGLPIIVTDVGDLKDAVHHGQTGILVSVDANVATVADEFCGLLADAGRRRYLGDNARQLIEGRYGIRATADRWDTFLSGLLRKT